MNLVDYTETTTYLLEMAQKIEKAKRPGYTMGADDCLANFKRVAERAGLTPGQVWTVYFLKHVDAIASAMSKPSIEQAEPMEGRFADALNYLKLGFALWTEGVEWNWENLREREAREQVEKVIDNAYVGYATHLQAHAKEIAKEVRHTAPAADCPVCRENAKVKVLVHYESAPDAGQHYVSGPCDCALCVTKVLDNKPTPVRDEWERQYPEFKSQFGPDRWNQPRQPAVPTYAGPSGSVNSGG
jgi:hypothetical protein